MHGNWNSLGLYSETITTYMYDVDINSYELGQYKNTGNASFVICWTNYYASHFIIVITWNIAQTEKDLIQYYISS